MRHLRPAVLGLLILAALTACSTNGPGPGPTRSSSSSSAVSASPIATGASSPSATQTASGSATASPAPSSGSTGDPNRPSGQCADTAIRVQLSMPKGAAGSFLQDVSFTNTGSSPCVLRGAPGLSVVGDGNGTQLGAPATRDQADARTVRLAAHGGSVYAPFTGPELEPGTQGAEACTGRILHGDGYRVYPPHSTRAYFLKDADALACSSGGAFLRISVVRPTGTS